jgi:hypothetical protein
MNLMSQCRHKISANEKVLWSGGGFETRPPERPPS